MTMCQAVLVRTASSTMVCKFGLLPKFACMHIVVLLLLPPMLIQAQLRWDLRNWLTLFGSPRFTADSCTNTPTHCKSPYMQIQAPVQYVAKTLARKRMM